MASHEAAGQAGGVWSLDWAYPGTMDPVDSAVVRLS